MMAMQADLLVGDLVLITRPPWYGRGVSDTTDCDHPAKPIVTEPTPIQQVREAHAGRREEWVVVNGRAYPAHWAELVEGVAA